MARVVTTGKWGYNPQGKWGPLPLQPNEKLSPATLAAMGAAKAGGFGRLMQGMAGIGSKFAPAAGAAKAAAPMLQGAAAGAGFAAGQAAMSPVKAVFGWFADLKPENLYSGMVVFAALLYFLDFVTGFDITRTAELRVFGFGIGGFFILAIIGRFISFWTVVFAVVHFYSVYGLLSAFTGTFDLGGLNLGVLTSILTDKRTLIAFVLGSGALYVNLPIPGAIKFLPVFMLLETYGLPMFRERILDSVANINYASFFVTFLLNRVLFPLPLMYSIFAFYPESRTARKVLGVFIIVYLIAAIPQIKGAYAQYAGLTGEEKEQALGVLARIQTTVRNVVSGDIFRAPAESLYEKAEIAFGFGEPKEEPKMGLQLLNDPNMPKVFDLGFYNAPAPSIIMDVPNPLPPDVDASKRAIEIIEIKCDDKSETAKSETPVEPSPEPSILTPLRVTYKRPRTAKCEFQGLKEGSYTAEITVRYKFAEDAELSTAFMRSDKLEALIAAGEDPADVNKIPPARALYDNGPVAITWGPVELVTAPASVDLAGATKSSLVVYVAKSGTWEGEISGIEELTLTVPDNVALKKTDPTDRSCSFERVGATNTYKVKDGLIKGKSRTDPFKFIGDGVRLECETAVKPEVLGGADWAGAQFKVNGVFVFAIKKSVSFDVKGCSKEEKKTCLTEKNKCPGNQTCPDGTWSDCIDWPEDACTEGGAGAGA